MSLIGPGPSQGPGNPWWLAHYWQSTGVSSRFSQPSQPVYVVLQAASAAAAQAAVAPKADPGNPITVTGPYATQAAALAAESQRKSQIAKAEQAGSIPNPLSGLNAIGAFFSTLGEANLWIRVGEVALGLILIAVGVSHMTNAVPAATKGAGTVAKGAVHLI